jgi:hypothetical protein
MGVGLVFPSLEAVPEPLRHLAHESNNQWFVDLHPNDPLVVLTETIAALTQRIEALERDMRHHNLHTMLFN